MLCWSSFRRPHPHWKQHATCDENKWSQVPCWHLCHVLLGMCSVDTSIAFVGVLVCFISGIAPGVDGAYCVTCSKQSGQMKSWWTALPNQHITARCQAPSFLGNLPPPTALPIIRPLPLLYCRLLDPSSVWLREGLTEVSAHVKSVWDGFSCQQVWGNRSCVGKSEPIGPKEDYLELLPLCLSCD